MYKLNHFQLAEWVLGNRNCIWTRVGAIVINAILKGVLIVVCIFSSPEIPGHIVPVVPPRLLNTIPAVQRNNRY